MSTHQNEFVNYIKSIYKGSIVCNDFGKILALHIPEKEITILYRYKATAGIMMALSDVNEVSDIIIDISEANWVYRKDLCMSIIKTALGIDDCRNNNHSTKHTPVHETPVYETGSFSEPDRNTIAEDRFSLYEDLMYDIIMS